MTKELSLKNDQDDWTPVQLAALKQMGLGNAGNADLAVFMHQAKRTGLDPFSRQIYMIERGGKFGIQTSIDGFRIIAQRSGEYAGQTAPYWCGEDGVWKDVWLSKTAPAAAKIGVYRQGFAEPLWAIATLEAYMPLTRDGRPMGLWNKMPDVMLAKCAESLALRKAFPNDLSGLYTDEEMSQAEAKAPAEPKAQPVEVAAAPVVPALAEDDWHEIVAQVLEATTKDELKAIGTANKDYMDHTIVGCEPLTGTLRDLFIQRVAELDKAE